MMMSAVVSQGGTIALWDDPAARLRRRLVIAGLALCILLIDLLTTRVALPILYTICLVLAARAGDRRLVIGLAFPFVLLTYFSYAFELRYFLLTDIGHLASYRLLNRTMVAISILIVAAMLSHFLRLREQMRWQRSTHLQEPDREIYQEVIQSLENLSGAVVTGLLILSVLVADLLVPGQFNLPILYAVPLLLAGWRRSRRLLWALVAILLLFSLAGFAWGRSPTTQLVGIDVLLANRTLAIIVLLAIGVVLHFWIGRNRSQPAS
jgi:hypothetical protein